MTDSNYTRKWFRMTSPPALAPISDAESVVMELLWAHAPQSADELVSALRATENWQEATIKTFLNRLLKKGVIRAHIDGRRYLYEPVLARAAWVDAHSRSVLDRLFGGKVAPLVAHFSERQQLSADDIAALRRIIDAME
jgi:predicted transcriptional regulator